MADTSSIASRMEKLAKLKRMKLEKAGGAAPVDPTVESTPDSQTTDAVAQPPDDEVIQLSAPETTPEPAQTAESVTTEELADAFGGSAEDLAVGAVETELEADTDDLDLGTEIPADLLDDEDDEADAPELADTADDEVAEAEASEAVADEVESVEETNEAEAEVAEVAEADVDADLDAILSAEDLGIDEEEALDSIAASAAVADVGVTAAAAASEAAIPDFAEKDIDPAVLEREFENEAPEAAASSAKNSEEGLISLTFDESRSTLLNHVSRQMDCSVEDVVVTALDWYLDALFGEEGEEGADAKSA